MSDTVSNQPSFWSKNKKKIIWGGLIVGFVGLGYVLWWLMMQPVMGTVRVREVEGTSLQEKNLKKRLYQGKYVTFSYEGGYEEKSHQLSPKGPVLESVLLVSSAIDGRKIAVTVANRGTTDLESDPSYQIRVADRETYKQSPFSQVPFQGVLFEKNEAPFEKTIFLSSHGLIVSVALSSLFRQEGIEAELEALMSDFSISGE